MKNLIQPVKGTRDFYPEDMALSTWMYNIIREVSESFGYQEYEGPILESIDLYAARSGEELVKKQSFVFLDRGGNQITMRPELTPSLARMVAQRQHQLTYPIRWWSYGPMWRYERPQKGRAREFYQWNIDLIGVEPPEADAELIAIGARLLKKVGLSPEEVSILVNHRGLMETELNAIGISPEKRLDVFRLIDRRDKMRSEDWGAYAFDVGLSSTQYEELQALLENEYLWQKSDDLIRVFNSLDALGVRNYVRFSPNIIRGLDYYSGTIFECYDKKREFRSIFAGGRYDSLVADVGGEPIPATGFAMGDKVIPVVLEKFNRLPNSDDLLPSPVLMTVFNEDSMMASFKLAAELRDSGINVATYPQPVKLGKQLKYAGKIGASVVVILGPEEQASDSVAIKDLQTRDQQSVPRRLAAEIIRNMLVREAVT